MEANDYLQDWLIEHRAIKLMVTQDRRVTLSFYHVNGHIFIVRTWPGETGWDVFIPASESTGISETLNALNDYVSHGRKGKE